MASWCGRSRGGTARNRIGRARPSHPVGREINIKLHQMDYGTAPFMRAECRVKVVRCKFFTQLLFKEVFLD